MVYRNESSSCATMSRFTVHGVVFEFWARAMVRSQPLTHCLHPVMANAPFPAVGVAQQARGGEEQPAPAPHPERGIAAIDVVEHFLDLVAPQVKIAEPVLRGALVVRSAPAPLLFDLE